MCKKHFREAGSIAEVALVKVLSENTNRAVEAANKVKGSAIDAVKATAADVGKPNKNNKRVVRKDRAAQREVADELYAMSTSERGGYDIVFMQVSNAKGQEVGAAGSRNRSSPFS